MKIAQIIRKRLRQRQAGTNVAADVNAVVSANVGEAGHSSSHVESSQRVVQRSEHTEVTEDDARTTEGRPS